MQTFDLGKKVFFLYPPQDFSKTVINRLFAEGYEIYKLNSTDALVSLMHKFPDSVLFINTDYPYKSFDFDGFCNTTLKEQELSRLLVYTVFSEKVSFADTIKDYIAINRPEEEIYSDLSSILKDSGAHGKREYVRYGCIDDVLSTISFFCEGAGYTASMHDISPKALSFSSEDDLESLVGKDFSEMELSVGAYNITVQGRIEVSRMMGGKKIYIAVFDLDDASKGEVFDFIFTSLEKSMDETIQKIQGS